jgi:hypothetical protein
MLSVALAPDAQLDAAARTLRDPYHSATLPDGIFDVRDGGDILAAPEHEVVLASLAELGLAFVRMDADRCHWTELVARLVLNVRTHGETLAPSIFETIANGNATKEQVEAWIMSMFLFTKSAAFHTGEMLYWSMQRREDAAFWRALFDEESGHWKIYRRIFSELGLNHETERHRRLVGSVGDLLTLLRDGATLSEAHYAAMLYPIEQGPDAAVLDDDPCFGALVRHYGFSESAVAPLFLHTRLNAELGHSRIWVDVIRRGRHYDRRTADDILRMSNRQLTILTEWGREIEQGLYRTADR